ncbi:unnamed protein product [Dracunculus medinensis]|uniref:Flavin-containing monooxygenase n=1 Tax=Dracunculus medinensis TaxID=318479 RepID=A0A0N4U8W5_DRAME|nr:unnamed protein product [Dracunculus medinensis]
MRIGVVGAGASGLTAIKTCLENDFQVVCLEKDDDLGGLWRFKNNSEVGKGSVMKNTVINTSKEMTAYSDFPPPKEAANFMHHSQLLEYLRSYAKHFALLQYIKFNHQVISIERSEKYEENGQWTVTYTNLMASEKNIMRETFDGIMLCTGHHTEPYFPPPFPGQGTFKGKILHSHDYKDPTGMEEKRVVVVGIGNSGSDVAVDLSKTAKKVHLSTRSGTWLINRTWDYGVPFDTVLQSRFILFLKRLLPYRLINSLLENKLNRRVDHGRFGLKPGHCVLAAHFTINDELPNRIASGSIEIKSNISHITKNDVIFDDDTVVEDVDVLIFATGYSFSFPIVESGKLIPVEENKINLYKYMFPPQLSPKNTFAIIGLIQPLGSIIPISEMQCRVFCEVLNGRVKLPDYGKMNEDINKKRKILSKEFLDRRRHTIQVYYIEYMDELAKMIGVKPNITKYVLNDPNLARILFFHAASPYQYRLMGTNSWPEARNALFEMEERTFNNTRTRRTKETLNCKPRNKIMLSARIFC